MSKSTYTQGSHPARQGFYAVKTASGDEFVAEWREHVKELGKTWYRYAADEPTQVKQPTLLMEQVVEFRAASRDEVAKLMARELTHEERIERAVQEHLRLFEIDNLPAPPACRTLAVGDPVEVGALEDAHVAALADNGRVVVVTCAYARPRRGEPEVRGLDYRAFDWTSVVRKGERSEEVFGRRPFMDGTYLSSAVDSLLFRCLRGLEFNPDYQRGYVWSDEDKQRYLDSVFQGRELGRFLFVTHPYPRKTEVLDGKQRLSCLWDFWTSQLTYRGKYFHQLSEQDAHLFRARSVQFADLSSTRMSRADLLQIFLEVNAAGVPQTEEHLAHVRALLEQELQGAS